MPKSTKNRSFGASARPKIDAKTIPGRSGGTPGRPRSFEGRPGASPVRPKSVPRASQGRPKSAQGQTGTPKRLSKSARTRAEATKIDGKSALGALTSSKFVWVARKTLTARCHVDFRQVSQIGRTSFRTAPVGKNKDSAHRAGHRRAATKNLENRPKFDRKSSVEAAWGSVLTVEGGQSSDSGRLAATRGASDDPGRSARRPRSLGSAAWRCDHGRSSARLPQIVKRCLAISI